MKCPKCESLQFITERRLNGKQCCKYCGYVIRDGSHLSQLPKVNADTPMPEVKEPKKNSVQMALSAIDKLCVKYNEGIDCNESGMRVLYRLAKEAQEHLQSVRKSKDHMKHTTHSLAKALLKSADKPVIISAMDVDSEFHHLRYFGNNIIDIVDDDSGEITICVDVESNNDKS